MLAALIGVLIIALLGLIAYVANHPSDFRLERSTTVRAAPERLFDLISDFHRWTAWSPFETIDADLKRPYGGAERGVGATYGWEGRKSGVGSRSGVAASNSASHGVSSRSKKGIAGRRGMERKVGSDT